MKQCNFMTIHSNFGRIYGRHFQGIIRLRGVKTLKTTIYILYNLITHDKLMLKL
jgi:hypothetical protein